MVVGGTLTEWHKNASSHALNVIVISYAFLECFYILHVSSLILYRFAWSRYQLVRLIFKESITGRNIYTIAM